MEPDRGGTGHGQDYRIGQNHNVMVRRLICHDTFEERVDIKFYPKGSPLLKDYDGSSLRFSSFALGILLDL